MNIQRFMFNKKGQAIFDTCEKFIDAYRKARNKQPDRIQLKKKDYDSLLSSAADWCKKNKKDKPEDMKIGMVKLEKANV